MKRKLLNQSKDFILIVALFVLSGSLLFGNELTGLRGLDELSLIPREVKLDVVYIPQNDTKSCATTSAAMAISYYENLNNAPLDKETVWKISEMDESVVCKYGNDMEGLTKVANHYGYRSEFLEYMKVSDVECLLFKGVLVILNIRAGRKGSATHCVLVTGYDKDQEIFYINDPANSVNKVLEYSDLAARWSAYLNLPKESHRSGFIIYPNSKVEK